VGGDFNFKKRGKMSRKKDPKFEEELERKKAEIAAQDALTTIKLTALKLLDDIMQDQGKISGQPDVDMYYEGVEGTIQYKLENVSPAFVEKTLLMQIQDILPQAKIDLNNLSLDHGRSMGADIKLIMDPVDMFKSIARDHTLGNIKEDLEPVLGLGYTQPIVDAMGGGYFKEFMPPIEEVEVEVPAAEGSEKKKE
jgi:hypothetical protein